MKKIILILVILLGVGLYMYQSPFLNPYLPSDFKHQINKANPKIKNTLYVWKDKNGQRQITDSPPTDNTPYETLTYKNGELVNNSGSTSD